jgi:hypothetical protein
MRALSRRSFLTALGALGVGLRARRAHSTTVVPITVDALTRRSELVVLGTVRAASSQWRERFIVTDCDVRVEAVLKGPVSAGATVGVRVAEFVVLLVAVCVGVDLNPLNACGAAKAIFGSGECPVLVRFESNPAANQYRLTVHTSNGQLTAAIKNIVMAQLAAPN